MSLWYRDQYSLPLTCHLHISRVTKLSLKFLSVCNQTTLAPIFLVRFWDKSAYHRHEVMSDQMALSIKQSEVAES